jgi:hypothetical protein
MDPRLKFLWIALAAAVLAAHAARANAMVASDRHEPGGDAVDVWHLAPARDRAQSERLIERAVRDLQRAAQQADFASNEHLLALLQSAQDKLTRAAGRLLGERWLLINRLLADIDHAIARGSAPLGPTVSPGGESFGPPALGRKELAGLVKEGQALVQHTAEFRSPADTDDIAWDGNDPYRLYRGKIAGSAGASD